MFLFKGNLWEKRISLYLTSYDKRISSHRFFIMVYLPFSQHAISLHIVYIVHDNHALRTCYTFVRACCIACTRSHIRGNPVLPIQSRFPTHAVIHITVRSEIVAYRKRELHRRHREITPCIDSTGGLSSRVSRCCRHFKHAGNMAKQSLI